MESLFPPRKSVELIKATEEFFLNELIDINIYNKIMNYCNEMYRNEMEKEEIIFNNFLNVYENYKKMSPEEKENFKKNEYLLYVYCEANKYNDLKNRSENK